jgi:hypothetical protein
MVAKVYKRRVRFFSHSELIEVQNWRTVPKGPIGEFQKSRTHAGLKTVLKVAKNFV